MWITGLWVWKSLSKEMARKYRRVLLLDSLLPGIYQWRSHVAPNDLPLIEQHRKRNRIYIVVMVVPLLCFWLYLYLRYLHPLLVFFNRY
jgi:hypothetical protein